jgi:hypothetical protein
MTLSIYSVYDIIHKPPMSARNISVVAFRHFSLLRTRLAALDVTRPWARDCLPPQPRGNGRGYPEYISGYRSLYHGIRLLLLIGIFSSNLLKDAPLRPPEGDDLVQ